MVIRDHQEIAAWRLARELERRVVAFTATPPANRDANFCEQIRNSSSSAPRNIAEGFGRFWPLEFAHKLRIAIGELHETQDHLDRALEEKFISATQHQEMYTPAARAIGASVNFAKYLESAGPDWKKNYRKRSRGRNSEPKNPEPQEPQEP
jgi:four helix bundle protein